MNKADVEFTIGLNTSPAEQQLDKLYDKMRLPGVDNRADPLLQQVSREYQQGFKMVGGVYDTGSNHFAVPSIKVFETALVVTSKSIQKFNSVVSNVINLSNSIIDAYAKKISQPLIEYKPNNFSPYKNAPHISPVYQQFLNERERGFTFGDYEGNNYDVPSTIINSGGLVRTGRNVSKWSPSEFYTRDQVDSINYNLSHNDIFNSLIYKRKANKPYNSAYDLFNQIHSPQGASGMYDIWQGLFGRKGILALPPSQHIWTGASGDDTPEEQGKDLVEQEKKDNNELKEKLRLWVKIGSTIYAIRKVIQGLAKLWKFGAETVSGVNSNINEEHGFFSTDPEGALLANSDKTRAMLYAGVRNMGENTPVSKSGLDYASSKMTELWTSAMSGRNVDARTTIDVQRLKDFFGIDLTVAGLLTGERQGKTATDIQIDMMDKVEKQISKLAEADEVTKGQVIDSLKNILGDELVNAIVANANKNLKIDATDLKLTLSERIMQHGGSAIASGDLTEKTTKAVDAISEFKDSLQTLKNTIISSDGINNAFVNFTKALKGITDWITEKLNKVEGEKNAVGEVKAKVSIASLTAEEYSRYRNFPQKENDVKDVYKNKDTLVKDLLKSGNALDVLQALYLSQPEVKNASNIENLGIKQQEIEIGTAFKNRNLDPNSDNPIIRELANHPYTNPYTGETTYGFKAFSEELATNPNIGWNDPFTERLITNAENMDEHEMLIAMRNLAKNNPAVRDAFKHAFDKGGTFDFSTGMNVIKYLYSTDMLGFPEEQLKAYQVLASESHQVLDKVVDMDVQHVDRNNNGKVDKGEIMVTVVVKDQSGNEMKRDTFNAELN